jgi:hypothetical protein
MSTHVTSDSLARLSPTEAAAAARHAASCPACATLIEAYAEGILLATEHVDPELLIGYETLDAAQRETVDAHIADCPMCARELADLECGDRVAAFQAPTGVGALQKLAIAAAVAIVATVLLLSRKPPAPAPPPVVRVAPPPVPAPAKLHPLVEEALQRGRLPLATIASEVRSEPDVLRGERPTLQQQLEPAGVVVETTRPSFRWPEERGAAYVLSIYDDETEVARSPRLTHAAWTVDRDLARGRVLHWQVEITKNGASRIIPMPPAPRALFAIAAADAHEALERARREHPEDHLVLAVLYARAGMEREANAELARADEPRIVPLRPN